MHLARLKVDCGGGDGGLWIQTMTVRAQSDKAKSKQIRRIPIRIRQQLTYHKGTYYSMRFELLAFSAGFGIFLVCSILDWAEIRLNPLLVVIKAG